MPLTKAIRPLETAAKRPLKAPRQKCIYCQQQKTDSALRTKYEFGTRNISAYITDIIVAPSQNENRIQALR